MDAESQVNPEKRNFILIDQSIVDFSGHHYEYAHRVLNSAQKAGFHPILITNRKFRDHQQVPYETLSLYKYGLWLTFSKPWIIKAFESFTEWLRMRLVNIKARLVFSTLGILWLNRTNVPKILSVLLKSKLRILNLFLFFIFSLLAIPFAIIYGVWLLIPFKNFFGNLLSSGWQRIGSLFKPIGIIFQPNNIFLKSIGMRMKTSAFTRDTRKMLSMIKPQKDDVIFIPTLGTEELTGLIPILENPGQNSPGWHLLFRRNAYIGRTPEYLVQEEGLRRFKNQFKQVFNAAKENRLFFYTDTEELSNQYNRFSTYDFETLPIPAADKTLDPEEYQTDSKPIHIIYIGDARTEKGYHFFPNIVRDLTHPYLKENRISFSIQSNFNIPGGEPKPRIAKADLQQLKSPNVSLIDQVLSTEEYNQLLRTADLLPILYDPVNYYARSSGIFVEALVLGKPVLVPAGTWMSKELNAAISEYHIGVLEHKNILKTRTMDNTFWHVNGKPKSIANDGNVLLLIRSHARYSYLSVPNGATHVLFKTNQCPQTNGNFIKIHFQELINQEKPVRHQVQVIGGQECLATCMFKISPHTRRIWIGLSNAYADFPLEIENIEIHFIASDEDIPLNAVGVIYSNQSQISKGLKEIINHFPHYHRSAQQFGVEYSRYHQPDTLIERMVERNDQEAQQHE